MSLSFRARVLLLVLAVGLVPMALLGLWLNRSVERSGERLLGERLQETTAKAAGTLGSSWNRLRSELLDVAESPFALDVLRGAEEEAYTDRPPPSLSPAIWSAVLQSSAGEVRWRYLTPAAAQDAWVGDPLLMSVSFPVTERGSDTSVGRLEAELTLTGILGSTARLVSTPGMVLGVFERGTGQTLLPLPLDPALLHDETFDWGGDSWITSRRDLREPSIRIVAAAPVAPFMRPFEEASRQGLGLLLILAVSGLTVGAVLTGRLTRSLERLSVAAASVAGGDLEQRVELARNDEVGRLALAFNAMTESLQRTLKRLAEAESLAAVGEFAASMAHEIRNPLSAVVIDLERVEEGLPADSPLRRPQRRALGQLERLGHTVTGSLELARSGTLSREAVDLEAVLESAAHASRPAFEARRAVLELPEAAELQGTLLGDAAKLEQLLLNVLLNAAQSLGEDGGWVRVSLVTRPDEVIVVIRDSGSGIPAADLEKVFEPFYSTRREGTGLGLPTAVRIARAHGGDVAIESAVGEGTKVEVRLPLRAVT